MLSLGHPSTLHSEDFALHLSGAENDVSLPVDGLEDITNATFECWINWAEPGYYSQPFGHGETFRMVGLNCSPKDQSLQFFFYDQNQEAQIIRVENLIHWNQWFHVALVFGSDGMKLYCNGILTGTNPHTGTIGELNQHSSSPFLIGGRHWDENSFFRGRIDRIRFWNCTRTAEEIQASMHQVSPSHTDGLLGNWTFDSQTLADESGHENHGVSSSSLMFEPSDIPQPENLPKPIVVDGTVRFPQFLSPMSLKVVGNNTRVHTQGELRESGSFKMTFMDTDSSYFVNLETEYQGQCHKRIDLGPGQNHLNLRWEETATISGHLTNYFEQPSPGNIVEALQDGVVVAYAKSDLSGRYQLALPVTGQVVIRTHRTTEQSVPSLVETVANSGPYSELDQILIEIKHGDHLREFDFRFAMNERGNWRHFHSFDGLDSNIVTDLTLSDSGNLWIGTWTGSVTSLFNHSNTLTKKTKWKIGSEITNVEAGDHGDLWVGTARGGLVNLTQDQIVRFRNDSEQLNDAVRKIYRDREGQIFIAGERGVSRMVDTKLRPIKRLEDLEVTDIVQANDNSYWLATLGAGAFNLKGDLLTHHSFVDGLADNNVTSLAVATDGSVYFGTERGISRLRNSNFDTIGLSDGLPNSPIRDLFADDDGALWVATEQGLIRVKNGEVITYGLEQELLNLRITSILRDRSGFLWVGSHGGLSRLDDRSFLTFDKRDGVASDGVVTVMRDSAGKIWAGGYKVTRDSHPLLANSSTHFAPQETKLNDNTTAVLAIAEDSGSTLIGTNNGELVILRDGKTVAYRSAGLRDHVNAILVIGPGKHVLGTSFGARTWDPTTESYNLLSGLAGDETVYALQQLPTGELWLGTNEGIIVWKDRILDRITTDTGLPNNTVIAISIGTDGTVWVGTLGGIAKLKNNEFATVDDGMGIAGQRIYDIESTKSGVMVFATNSGVSLYDGNSWARLDSRDGMAGNEVRDIFRDSQGDLWFACMDGGITRYRVNQFPPRMNIETVEFAGNRIPFPEEITVTSGARVTFNLAATDAKTLNSKQQFRVRLDSQHQAQQTLRESQQASLSPQWRSDDSGWNSEIDSSKFEWLTQDPGSYVFAAQCVDRDLNYSPTDIVRINVVPKWYNRPAFVLSTSIFAGGALIFTLSSWIRFTREKRRRVALQAQLLTEEARAKKTLQRKNSELISLNSQLKHARDAAESANEAKSSFLANISHEIRTPLNAVIGASTLMHKKSESGSTSELIDVISSSSTALLALVDNILDIARIEAGELALKPEPCNLRMLVHSVIEIFHGESANTSVSLQHEVDASVPSKIYTDPSRLRQILINLVGNALKFTRKGSVRIHLRYLPTPTPSKLEVSVRDTGIGIPKDKLAELFLPFRQVDSGNSRAVGGTGLGLAISQSIVHAMGGTLEVESKVGVGSRFFFQIDAPEVNTQLHNSLKGLKFHGKRIMLMGFNSPQSQIIKDRIKQWGATLDEIESLSDLDSHLNCATQMIPVMVHSSVLSNLQESDRNPEQLVQLFNNREPAPRWVLISSTEFQQSVTGLSCERVKPETMSEADLCDLIHLLFDDKSESILRPNTTDLDYLDKRTAERWPLRILIVEDTALNRRILNGLLLELGYKPDMAASGYEAMTQFNRSAYDVVIMDIRMPKMDGFQTTQRIREFCEQSGRKQPFIIAMTANASFSTRTQCFDAGMDGFLTKPCSNESLVNEVKRAHESLKGENRTSRRASSDTPPQPHHDAPYDISVINRLAAAEGTSPESRQQLKEEFRQALSEIATCLTHPSKDDDWVEVAVAAHKLISLSAQFGAQDVSDLSSLLEQAIDQGEYAEASYHLQNLTGELDQFRRWLDSA